MPTEHPVPKRALAPANGCRVLVVDDDEDNRELLVVLLRREGYTTTAAENGAEALAVLAEGFDPDVVLTDLMMPVMSGWELCERLKKDSNHRSIPLVVSCGMVAELRGKLQVDAAFEKPVDAAALLEKVAELCGR